MKLAIAFLLFSTVIYGQTAKVVQLSDEDAAQAKSLQNQQKALDAKTKDFDKHITEKYLLVDGSKGGGCLTSDGSIKSGWGCGDFEYSDDYKFIVPKTQKGGEYKLGAPLPCGSIYCNGIGVAW